MRARYRGAYVRSCKRCSVDDTGHYIDTHDGLCRRCVKWLARDREAKRLEFAGRYRASQVGQKRRRENDAGR